RREMTEVGKPRVRRGLISVVVVVWLCLAGLAVGAAPAAARSDCPQFRCSADHAGTGATTISAANVGGLGSAWALQTGGRVYGSPSLKGGLLYVPSEDGNVYAVNP